MVSAVRRSPLFQLAAFGFLQPLRLNLFLPPYSVGYDFGSIKRLDRYPMGALSTLYICFMLKKHYSDFIKVYFDSLKWYKEIYKISAEGARNHGLLNMPTDEFFNSSTIQLAPVIYGMPVPLSL